MRRSARVKVLVVLPASPAPEAGAADRCAVGLLRGLLSHGVDVTTVAPVLPATAPAPPPHGLDVELVPQAPAEPGLRSRLAHLRRPLFELGSGALAARVRTLATAVDVVHVETAEMTWSVDGVETPNLLHVHYRARLDRPLDWPWRPAARELALYAAMERRAIRRHRYLVANSPVVAATMRRAAPRAEVVEAPLTLDPASYGPAPLDGPPVAGIIGTYDWPPTRRAMHRLVDGVWPAVRRQLPEARLRIAGRGTAGSGLRAADAGVEVVGEVPSAAHYLRDLSVLAYPLDRGSGTKVKVLEALACGIPVVTTPCGAEGIAPNDGVVVVDAEEDFVRAVTAVLADPAERRERGAAARAHFLEAHSPTVATAPLVELYRRMVAR